MGSSSTQISIPDETALLARVWANLLTYSLDAHEKNYPKKKNFDITFFFSITIYYINSL